MKRSLFLLFTLSIVTCKSISLETKPPFTITEASYKSWVGGQPGVHGINVYLSYTSKSTVDFDSIYFRNRVVKLSKKQLPATQILMGYFNTSTVNSIEDLKSQKEGPKKDHSQKQKLQIPFILKQDEAVISYTEGNGVKYYKVLNLKRQASDFYP